MARQQQAHQGIQMVSVENHWLLVFNRYDVDGDGRIPLSDFKAMLLSNRFEHDIPERALKQIVRNADTDKNGFIDFNEFLSLVESKEGRRLFSQYMDSYIRNVIPRRTRRDITDGDYENQYTCTPPALGMLTISIVEIGLFLYDASITHNPDSIEGPMSQDFLYDPKKRNEVWRFLTYMFVHVGIAHLLSNIMVQVLLGIPLEMVHRWWRVLIIYFAGVIAGSLATSLSDPYTRLAGASGGVYALITAHIATIIMNWSEMQYAIRQLLVFLVFVVVDLGSSIHARYASGPEAKKVAYVAHLGGAATGLLVGLYVLRNLEVHSWERILCWLSIAVFTALIAVAIFWNFAFPDYFSPKEYSRY